MKKIIKTLFLSAICLTIVCGCKGSSSETSLDPYAIDNDDSAYVDPRINDEVVPLTLSTTTGLEIKFLNKGATIDSITMNGTKIGSNGFVAGRVANRIAGGEFELNGETYTLDKNDNGNTLHGGSQGFGQVDWTLVEQTYKSIKFSYTSAHLDQGFPGKLEATVTYTLKENGDLIFEYTGVSDKDTIYNPTNHLFLNLNGDTSANDHGFYVDANKYTEVDSKLIPTGNLLDVDGTIYDYTKKKAFQYTKGYDINFVLNGEGYRQVATLEGRNAKIRCDIYTDRPGLQVYNNNAQIVLEPQNFPDAIHHENFPSDILKAGETFYSRSKIHFEKY